MSSTLPTLDVILCEPRGFCAGVERAIRIVELALEKYGAPIYVRHEIVHNRRVVEDLQKRGVVFVAELDEIPDGGMTVFSAHGIAERVEREARERGLPVIDATCPLVTKVHHEAQRYEAQGRELILIGHAGHPEVEGTSGRVKGKAHLVQSVEDVSSLQVSNEDRLAYVTQTTLSVDDTREILAALHARFPNVAGPALRDICYATQNRQNAVRALKGKVDLLLVIGAENSSNSNRLRDLGEEMGIPSHLIPDAAAFRPGWLDNVFSLGITAGASAPEQLVQELISRLLSYRVCRVESLVSATEKTHFRLPPEVIDAAA